MQSHLHCVGYRLASSKPHHAAVLDLLHADRVKILLVFHVFFHWYAMGISLWSTCAPTIYPTISLATECAIIFFPVR